MIPRFLYPLLPFRSFLHPILVVSAIGLPCWLAVRLYRGTRGYRLSFGREILLLTFVVYLLALAAVTLAPNHGAQARAAAASGIGLRPNLATLTCSAATMPRSSTARSFCRHNAGGNVALFFPLGMLLPLVWPRARFWNGMLIAIALSSSIELIQFFSTAWGGFRSADVNDVILNTFGAFLGLVVGSLLRMILSTWGQSRL